jgi:apolipoprotein N-acyltransferase
LLAPLGLARLVMGDVDFARSRPARDRTCPASARRASRSATRSSSPARSSIGATAPTSSSIPSNDAWFGKWGPPQHLAQARLRAIEEGLPILRSTPTGISAVIDARGRVLESCRIGQEGAIELAAARPLPPTCSRASATGLPSRRRRILSCSRCLPPLAR